MCPRFSLPQVMSSTGIDRLPPASSGRVTLRPQLQRGYERESGLQCEATQKLYHRYVIRMADITTQRIIAICMPLIAGIQLYSKICNRPTDEGKVAEYDFSSYSPWLARPSLLGPRCNLQQFKGNWKRSALEERWNELYSALIIHKNNLKRSNCGIGGVEK